MVSRQIALGCALFAQQALTLPISPYVIRMMAATNSSIGNFGSCSVPQIKFATGFDNRKETSFEPVDQGEPFKSFCVNKRSDVPGRSFLQPWIRSEHRHNHSIHVWRISEYLRRGSDGQGHLRKRQNCCRPPDSKDRCSSWWSVKKIGEHGGW